MNRYFVSLILICLGKTISLTQPPTTSNVWLVSVGIGAYQHDDILTRLDFTIQGAYDFRNLFADRQLLGSNPPVLTNQKARRTDIIKALENTFINNPEVKTDDMILFYFSGHGEITGGKAGICPYDYAGDVRGLITDEEIQAVLQRSPARHKACFIEACKTEAQSAGIFDPSILESFNQKRRNISGGLVYMTSTKAGEKSWGKPDIGGYFTHFLLRGLEGEANDNDDAYITVDELFGFVQRGVKSFSLDKQVPQINDRKNYDVNIPLIILPNKLPKDYYPPGFEYLSADMIFIPGGEFDMGDAFNVGDSTELPVHKVTVKDFYLNRYEVTQALWKAVIGSNPSFFKDCDYCPVGEISWDDAQEFIKKLNEKTDKKFRLPTEAEWEYAAREGGKKVLFGNGRNEGSREEIIFSNIESDKGSPSGVGKNKQRVVPVNSLPPNILGLYNMSGNVAEWCQDVWHENYLDAPTDGSAWINNGSTWTMEGDSFRVARGGCWLSSLNYCRTTSRVGEFPSLGFGGFGLRLARS